MDLTLDRADPDFRAAVAAIDAGDLAALGALLHAHPSLVDRRADIGEGYFAQPYLLWFVAGNPVRNATLPANSVAVADLLLRAAGDGGPPERIDTALALVASGRIARESGVQLRLIDRFVDAGAAPASALDAALAHRETAAVRHLLARGATPTLAVEAAVGTVDAVERLLPSSDRMARQRALIAAALYGRADILACLAVDGVDLDAYGPEGFHSHATALHQAVAVGSLSAVAVIVDAGASLAVRDRLYGGTPFDWARHLGCVEIAAWLESRG